MRQRTQKKWHLKQPDIDVSLTLAAELGLSPLVARLLVNRGIKTAQQATTYLEPTFADLHSPFDMADMTKAVERIRQAIKNGEQIYVYGDYDTDGTTATALLLNVFRHLDAPAKYHIPNRFTDGYGLNKEAVEEIRKEGGTLLITVDCGIRSIDEIKLANELGMDVILTDHHQPPEDAPPPAHAIISPKVEGNEYPYPDLAGVGLAFKMAQALIENDEPFLVSLLDLVVLGTVVDIAPLTGENRTLSRLGLAEIDKRNRPGIHALCNVSGYHDKPIVGYSLSFGLGPRINAAGRLDTAQKVVELLTTESNETAETLAAALDGYNKERRNIENEIREEAVERLKKDKKLERNTGLVVASETWHDKAQGVVGIVASRLVDQYHRPVFVLAINGDETTGSGRCIEGMNLADSLNSCTNLLIKHGGHAAAAGVTLKTKNIDRFEKAFNEYACKHLTESNLKPKLTLDSETDLASLTLETLEQFEKLEPFGRENPAPCFSKKGVTIKGQPTTMGKEKEHFSMFVSDGSNATPKKAIGWRKSEYVVPLSSRNISLDIAFSPEINEFRGTRSVRLNLKDLHIHAANRAPNLTLFPPGDKPASVRVADHRNQPKKDYLLNLIKTDEPSIIYVQSPEKQTQLLTRVIPEKSTVIGRHDATTSKAEEIDLLKKLESGELQAVVSDTTFSDAALKAVPVVRHLVFCHLVPQRERFFRQCRPAASSKETTRIHLIYNKDSDVALLKEWVLRTYPDENALRAFYKKLREIVSTDFIDLKTFTDALGTDPGCAIDTGLTIFEELRLLERKTVLGQSQVKLLPAEKRGLDRSKTYLKCQWDKQTCRMFAKFQLQQNIEQIWRQIKDECGIPDSENSEA